MCPNTSLTQPDRPLSGEVGRSLWTNPYTQTAEQIEQEDQPKGSIVDAMGIFESRIGGSTFWILLGVYEGRALGKVWQLFLTTAASGGLHEPKVQVLT